MMLSLKLEFYHPWHLTKKYKKKCIMEGIETIEYKDIEIASQLKF